MVKLANSNACTGCGACAFKCPKGCITMQENKIGIILPHIDESSCVGCHACEKVCPVLNEVLPSQSQKAYAAWSLDDEERRTSASGGIAAEMYKLAADNSYKIIGAAQQEDFSVKHEIAASIKAIEKFKNSKYVFSSAYDVFPLVKNAIRNQQKVLFIGLPCQVAAMRKLYGNAEHLLLVEVVCHGTTPVSYLRQHIDKLNKEAGDIAKRMSFRDPYTYTYTFTFTLYNADNKLFYAKRTKDGDTYQFGYHRAVSYRENCYHCRFAKPERNADITIADYHGLGLVKPAAYDAKKVSLILVNNEKGRDFVDRLIAEKRIFAEERPLEEPFKGEAQLRHPSLKTKYRKMFEEDIEKYNGDFEKAIKHTQNKYMREDKFNRLMSLPKRAVKKIIKIIGIR